MKELENEYKVERRSDHSKFYVVKKYVVLGPVRTCVGIVNRALSYDAANSLCKMKRVEEKNPSKAQPSAEVYP